MFLIHVRIYLIWVKIEILNEDILIEIEATILNEKIFQ